MKMDILLVERKVEENENKKNRMRGNYWLLVEKVIRSRKGPIRLNTSKKDKERREGEERKDYGRWKEEIVEE